MVPDMLEQDLFTEICKIPIIDPHSHINPHSPAAKNLDEILGYHYYTELAHSAGMNKGQLDTNPRDRVRNILGHLGAIDNTVQYSWFLDIARTFLGFEHPHKATADELWDAAAEAMAHPDWENQVLKKSNIEKVFLTNDFHDPLEGFDTKKYVPCLRTDDLVFHLDKPDVRQRLAKATGIEVGDLATFRKAVTKLFEHFTKHGAKACAISLPPTFLPSPLTVSALGNAPSGMKGESAQSLLASQCTPSNTFWILAEHCREFHLPFDLMIGVNRRVYANGVYQGQDLFDQRTSLLQYQELFNTFPEVKFCISVLTSSQNQELVSYSWIFPNVYTSGHWWYSNIPAYVEHDLRARLQAVPKNKQIGYYSDMYKLEFGLPKYNMFRRILAKVLADDFVKPRVYTEPQAVQLARLLLRENAQQIFKA